MSPAGAGGASAPGGPAGLLARLRAEGGLDATGLVPAGTGESGSAFWVTLAGSTGGLLKLMPDPDGTAGGYLGELDAILGRLRRRGYPVARWLGTGRLAGPEPSVFWVQERLPGTMFQAARPDGPDGAGELVAGLLPEIIRLNDAQAGLGRGDGAAWPALIRATLTQGGDGYCLHSTLERAPETSRLLELIRRAGVTCGPGIPAGRDFVHYDFNLANLLTDGTAVTGVVDINPPLLAGDRAFDLATLLFYGYEEAAARRGLAARLQELASPRTARSYLAHLALRQTDWSLRFYPGAAATARFLRIAGRVAQVIDGDPDRPLLAPDR